MNRLAVALQVGVLKMTGMPLNSVQLIPAAVLDFIGRQLGGGEATPRIASIRALYRRRRTLFDHQQAALGILGLRHLNEQAESGLIGALRREAADTFEVEALVFSGRAWLYEHHYVILPLRRLDSWPSPPGAITMRFLPNGLKPSFPRTFAPFGCRDCWKRSIRRRK
jgi:hypothetical protein